MLSFAIEHFEYTRLMDPDRISIVHNRGAPARNLLCSFPASGPSHQPTLLRTSSTTLRHWYRKLPNVLEPVLLLRPPRSPVACVRRCSDLLRVENGNKVRFDQRFEREIHDTLSVVVGMKEDCEGIISTCDSRASHRVQDKTHSQSSTRSSRHPSRTLR